MPLNLRQFLPGDIISAADFNLLAATVQDHESQLAQLGGLPAGPITVPVLFGQSLGQARAILTALSQPLSLGTVIDAFGNIVDVFAAGTQPRIVLNQIPHAGGRATSGTAVSLVVAAQSSGSGTGGVPATLQISGLVPNPVRVGGQLSILGQNFATLAKDNNVTIGGRPATPSALSNIGSLIVIVPEGIPGAPTAPGQTSLAGVQIVVTTALGQATSTCTVDPPLAIPAPAIISFTPGVGIVGQPLTIVGANFSNTAANNHVTFDGVTVAATSATTAQLVVTIPTSIPGLGQVGDDRQNVPISVGVGNVSSPQVSLRIRRLS